ncbi:hypothetical protein MAR_002111, partial [Mya arenaria]
TGADMVHWKDYIKTIYFDLSYAASFAGPKKLLKLTHDCNHVSYMAMHLIISSDDTVNQYTLAGQR